jgi:hypothetical protein
MSTPKNQWEYNLYNSFESYKKNFLSGNDVTAKTDLKRAISLAKKTDNINLLASVYLGECALNKAVGINDKCEKYLNIKDLADSKKLYTYYNFISLNLKDIQTSLLDKKYQNFALHLKQKDYKKANQALKEINDPSAKLIALNLLGDKAQLDSIKDTLKLFSHYGYKKGVIYLLKLYKEKTDNKNEKEIISKKIEVLQN